MHPQTGGSYRREKDDSLTRIDAQAEPAAPAEQPVSIAQEAEQPADTETPAEGEAPAKKGKA